jgi:sulfonate transport system substrate-binding protein
MSRTTWVALFFAGVLCAGGFAGNAAAEVTHITVARQYGVSYLPLMVMQHENLIEKQAKKEGLAKLTVDWPKFTGGNVMNDAILSGSLQFASGGVGPLVKIWAATKGAVKGVCAMNTMPLFLTTTNPNVKSIKDFTNKDRIALPAVKVSIQAVTLEMAAANAFGSSQYDKLDHLTVTMSHPDGMQAMLSGASEIDSHFTSPPFQYQELENPKVHQVLSSYDVLGGPSTFNVIWTTAKFKRNNPKVYRAFFNAFKEAIRIIDQDKHKAAKDYVAWTNSKLTPEFIYKILASPGVSFTITPKNTIKYANFMYKHGIIKTEPKSWKAYFFSSVDALSGS